MNPNTKRYRSRFSEYLKNKSEIEERRSSESSITSPVCTWASPGSPVFGETNSISCFDMFLKKIVRLSSYKNFPRKFLRNGRFSQNWKVDSFLTKRLASLIWISKSSSFYFQPVLHRKDRDKRVLNTIEILTYMKEYISTLVLRIHPALIFCN